MRHATNMNGSFSGRTVDADIGLSAFDRLPAPVRVVIREAPADYSCRSVAKQWRKVRAAGITAEAFAAHLVTLIAQGKGRAAFLTYGAAHPEATQ